MKRIILFALLAGCRGILGIDDPVIADDDSRIDAGSGSDDAMGSDSGPNTACLDKWQSGTVELTPPTIVYTSSGNAPGTPWVSPDELEMWFTDGQGSAPLTIYRATRTNKAAAFTGATIRTDLVIGSEDTEDVTLSADRLTVIFSSEVGPSASTPDLYIATRTSTSANFGAPVQTGLGTVNSSDPELYIALTSDGLHLYFSRFMNMTTTYYVASRTSSTGAFGPPMAIGGLQTDDSEVTPSPDQTVVLFSRDVGVDPNSMPRLFYATRSSPTAAVGTAKQLNVSAGLFDLEPFLTDDACAVYWATVDSIVSSRVIL